MTPGRDPAPAPTRLPGWLTGPMSRVYGAEVARRNRRSDRGVGVTRLDRPVISVGNLSAGGTGKTPMVRWVIGELQRLGRRPAIAMRGYKAGPDGTSDEAAEHAEALPGVPIVARPDRIAGLRALFATGEGRSVDCVVLDDGFQHRRLARDLDIVLIDATRPFSRDALIPAGFLREPASSLARADAVVITRAELASDGMLDRIETDARRSLGDADKPVVRATMRWGRVEVFGRNLAAPGPGDLTGRRLVACCAIGNPDAFFASAGRAGVEIVGRLVLPDHAAFTREHVERLGVMTRASGADGVLTTAKDWVKLARFLEPGGSPVFFVPRVGVELSDPALSDLIRRLFD